MSLQKWMEKTLRPNFWPSISSIGLADAARSGLLGRNREELQALRVTISESHVARAWYEGDLR